MVFEVYIADIFDKKLDKIIPKEKHQDIFRRLEKLAYNPYVHKPSGYTSLREMKLEKFRIYYAIFENELIVMAITVSDKKRTV